MALRETLSNVANDLFGSRRGLSAAFTPVGGFAAPLNSDAAMFTMLRALVLNNGCYDTLRNDPALSRLGLGDRPLKGLRNPSWAVVSFYADTLMSGPMEDVFAIECEDAIRPALEEARDQLFAWSNWSSKRQQYSRSTAMLGEVYLQVATKPDNTWPPRRVYLEIVQPDYVNVADSARDERGFLTRFRLDVPTRDASDRLALVKWHTEIWDKATQEARFWTRQSPPPQFEDELGAPDSVVPFADIGIDFVPFVPAPFLDIGEARGVSPILLAYDKIVELDALATSLHQLLYRHNNPDHIIEGAASGPGGEVPDAPNIHSVMSLDINGARFTSMPPGWTIHQEVAAINYADQLAAIQAHWDALRDTHLPELWYGAIGDSATDASGRALETRLVGAVSRAREARGNAEAALIRAMQMAFTIGQVHNLAPFTKLGTYESGGMDFAFVPRDVLPTGEDDELDLLTKRMVALQAATSSGASIYGAALVAGFDEEQATLLARADVESNQP